MSKKNVVSAVSVLLVAAVVGAVAIGAAPRRALAAPDGIPARPLDLDLKEADVRNVFRLLAEVSERSFVVDPCVHGAVDLRMKNVPLPLVYDALATQLHLVYESDGDAVAVRCAAELPSTGGPHVGYLQGAPFPDRVSLAETGAPLPDVAARLATAAHLAGVDYRASTRPTVNITLDRVRVATAASALADSTGLRVTVAVDRLVVADGR